MYAVVKNSQVNPNEDSPYSILNTNDHFESFRRGGIDGIAKYVLQFPDESFGVYDSRVDVPSNAKRVAVGELCGLYNREADAKNAVRFCEKKDRSESGRLAKKQEAEARALREKQVSEELALKAKQDAEALVLRQKAEAEAAEIERVRREQEARENA